MRARRTLDLLRTRARTPVAGVLPPTTKSGAVAPLSLEDPSLLAPAAMLQHSKAEQCRGQ